MAWAGTQTVTRPHPGLIVIETDTLDADGEIGEVKELTEEPDYQAVLDAMKKLS